MFYMRSGDTECSRPKTEGEPSTAFDAASIGPKTQNHSDLKAKILTQRPTQQAVDERLCPAKAPQD